MAYENINSNALITALNNCKTNLKYSASSGILTTPNLSWNTDAKTNFISGVDKLVNYRYKDLESTIDKFIRIAYSIKEYQNYQITKLNCETQIQSLNSQLYKTVATPAYKNKTKKVTVEKQIDPDVADKIDDLKSTTANCQRKMNELASKINSF